MAAFYLLPKNLDDDILAYEKAVNEYLRGEIDDVKIKALRVSMGVYEQRQSGSYMVRVRVAGGDIVPEVFLKFTDIAERYSKSSIHITSRQELQIHGVALTDTINIMKELKSIGMTTRGCGGNTVRNIIGSHDAGIASDEVFNISPYLRALTGRMIAEKDSWILPRKFKIAFSGNAKDTGMATMNDLGFIAKLNDLGERGFSVHIAGGMGTKPAIGTPLYDFIPESEVYNVTKAAKQLFDKHGNRKNKHAARLRFVMRKLGKEEFIKVLEKELEAVRSKKYPALKLEVAEDSDKGYVEIPVLLGDLDAKTVRRICEIASPFGNESLRLTCTQNLIIKNIPPGEVEYIWNTLQSEGMIDANTEFYDRSTACAGASTCRLGICLSRGLLRAIRAKGLDRSISFDRLPELSLKISGCPNTCSQHMIADIGFFGTAKRHKGKAAPAYFIVTGGIVQEGKTRLAEKQGVILAKAIPDFLAEFLDHANNEIGDSESFSDFLSRDGNTKIGVLIDKYNEIMNASEDTEIYYDWYSDKEFSMADRMEGECSAGMFDLIDIEMESTKKHLAEQEYAEATASASRALLVTKGIDIKGDIEDVKQFRDNFIGRHLDTSHFRVIEKYLKKETIEGPEAARLYEAVKDLYVSMDNSLRFPEVSPVEEESVEADAEFRDFRGVPCPMNFVKVKLVLETMEKGQILEILLDDGAPIDNVPGSVKGEGHPILDIEQIDSYWKVRIQKEG